MEMYWWGIVSLADSVYSCRGCFLVISFLPLWLLHRITYSVCSGEVCVWHPAEWEYVMLSSFSRKCSLKEENKTMFSTSFVPIK